MLQSRSSVKVLVKGLRMDQRPLQAAVGTLGGLGCGSGGECIAISPSVHKLPAVAASK